MTIYDPSIHEIRPIRRVAHDRMKATMTSVDTGFINLAVALQAATKKFQMASSFGKFAKPLDSLPDDIVAKIMERDRELTKIRLAGGNPFPSAHMHMQLWGKE